MISSEAIRDLETRVAQLEDTVRFMAEIMSDHPANDVRDIAMAIIAKGFPVSEHVILPPGRRGERSKAL